MNVQAGVLAPSTYDEAVALARSALHDLAGYSPSHFEARGIQIAQPACLRERRTAALARATECCRATRREAADMCTGSPRPLRHGGYEQSYTRRR